jgi:hypothetical protein
MLAFEIGNNLSLPKKVVIPGKFDCNQMMNLSERVWDDGRGSGLGIFSIGGGRGGHCSGSV